MGKGCIWQSTGFFIYLKMASMHIISFDEYCFLSQHFMWNSSILTYRTIFTILFYEYTTVCCLPLFWLIQKWKAHFFLLLLSRMLLWGPGCPGTKDVEQTDLQLPASPSWVLRLKVCVTMPSPKSSYIKLQSFIVNQQLTSKLSILFFLPGTPSFHCLFFFLFPF